MQIYISNFYNTRFFTPETVIVDTSYWAPRWFDPANGKAPHLDKATGCIWGIKEESFLMSEDEIPKEMCSGKPCTYIDKFPECEFLKAYWKHLQKIDFEGYLLPELNRIAEDVRKITHYEGEPKIVLMVHEKPENLCSERAGIVRLFKEHGIEVKEWTKELVGEVF